MPTELTAEDGKEKEKEKEKENDKDKKEARNAYWTNHPECVRRTWVERITNPPVAGTERWFHVEFDIGPLVGESKPGTPGH
jgi:hypothetical protein